MKKNEDNNEYKEFTLEFPMITHHVAKSIKQNCDNEKKIIYEDVKEPRRAVAIIGDRIYKGLFLSAKELKKAYKGWDRTLHDINHMGTTHFMGFSVSSDIRFFVGYQKNVAYDSKTKEVSMDIHVNENTSYGEAWRSYVNLCEEAGRIPNVSVAFLAKVGVMKVKDLPQDMEYGVKEDLEKDATIEYIYDIKPQALSTVFRGACNDEDGCGIGIKNCKTDKSHLSDEDYEKRRQEIINKLRKEDI